MNIHIVVATSQNGVIGYNNKLLWHIPQDLKRFKTLTLNHPMIMGRRTFESLPRVLPNRKHIVLTSNSSWCHENKNVIPISSPHEYAEHINGCSDVFVIGGQVVYEAFLPFADYIHLTKIYKNYHGDTFFPDVDYSRWEQINVMHVFSEIPCGFFVFKRK